jgi:hypothetical protein
MLRTRYSIDMPGADLLLTNSFARLMDGVIEAKHIGTGIVDGQRCEHLAFRNDDTDWQLWVRTGPQPLPCKYVITSKTMAAAPQYSVRFRNWNTRADRERRRVHLRSAGQWTIGSLRGIDDPGRAARAAPHGGEEANEDDRKMRISGARRNLAGFKPGMELADGN